MLDLQIGALKTIGKALFVIALIVAGAALLFGLRTAETAWIGVTGLGAALMIALMGIGTAAYGEGLGLFAVIVNRS